MNLIYSVTVIVLMVVSGFNADEFLNAGFLSEITIKDASEHITPFLEPSATVSLKCCRPNDYSLINAAVVKECGIEQCLTDKSQSELEDTCIDHTITFPQFLDLCTSSEPQPANCRCYISCLVYVGKPYNVNDKKCMDGWKPYGPKLYANYHFCQGASATACEHGVVCLESTLVEENTCSVDSKKAETIYSETAKERCLADGKTQKKIYGCEFTDKIAKRQTTSLCEMVFSSSLEEREKSRWVVSTVEGEVDCISEEHVDINNAVVYMYDTIAVEANDYDEWPEWIMSTAGSKNSTHKNTPIRIERVHVQFEISTVIADAVVFNPKEFVLTLSVTTELSCHATLSLLTMVEPEYKNNMYMCVGDHSEELKNVANCQPLRTIESHTACDLEPAPTSTTTTVPSSTLASTTATTVTESCDATTWKTGFAITISLLFLLIGALIAVKCWKLLVRRRNEEPERKPSLVAAVNLDRVIEELSQPGTSTENSGKASKKPKNMETKTELKVREALGQYLQNIRLAGNVMKDYGQDVEMKPVVDKVPEKTPKDTKTNMRVREAMNQYLQNIRMAENVMKDYGQDSETKETDVPGTSATETPLADQISDYLAEIIPKMPFSGGEAE